MASFECMPRLRICCSGAFTGVVVVVPFELLKAAAMADMGSETEERRGGRRARKKVEENSLTAVRCLSWVFGSRVEKEKEGGSVVYISRVDF